MFILLWQYAISIQFSSVPYFNVPTQQLQQSITELAQEYNTNKKDNLYK